MMRHPAGGVVGLAICLCFLAATAAGAEMTTDLFVAVDGNDTSPGTKEKPFATLTKARDAARKLPKELARRIVVRGGTGL